jgi:hypothetical protein
MSGSKHHMLNPAFCWNLNDAVFSCIFVLVRNDDVYGLSGSRRHMKRYYQFLPLMVKLGCYLSVLNCLNNGLKNWDLRGHTRHQYCAFCYIFSPPRVINGAHHAIRKTTATKLLFSSVLIALPTKTQQTNLPRAIHPA